MVTTKRFISAKKVVVYPNNAYKFRMKMKNMQKLRKILNNQRFVSGFISVAILTILFLTGPVSALLLNLTVK